MGKKGELTLFGGAAGWKASDWTASDDWVRGGKSQSYLECSDSTTRFHGTLDIKTLGGAGFASQRTTGEDRSWDLSDYDGIRIDLGESDGKRYTFILKNELLPKDPNGREQATISYEYDFAVTESTALGENSFVFIPWKDLTPTYRGREKKDAPKLDKKNVKRCSIMMRSFFGEQEGDFSLTVKSIKVVSMPKDLEKGFTGDKGEPMPGEPAEDDDSRWLISRSTLVGLMGISVTTYAICLLLCHLRGSPHMMWLWHR